MIEHLILDCQRRHDLQDFTVGSGGFDQHAMLETFFGYLSRDRFVRELDPGHQPNPLD